MKTIYKYPILLPVASGSSRLDLPVGSVILSVAEQHGGIVLYALVDTDQTNTVGYDVDVFGTGHEIPASLPFVPEYFVGTVSLFGGELMFHVFCSRSIK